MEEKRITDFGIQEVTLLNGSTVKIRPLTFKEKKDYLTLISQYKDISPENVATSYLDMQVEVAFFLIKVLNPEITKEIVETTLTGESFKQLLEVAFYDPFTMMGLGK
jgi:hypothetical protein